jgi:hypothetical protein
MSERESRNSEDDPHTGMTRPVLTYANLGDKRLSELTPAERIVAGIAWLADNSEHGIDDAAKKLIDEFRAFARSETQKQECQGCGQELVLVCGRCIRGAGSGTP